MSEARRDPSEVGREVATRLMLRQLYVVVSNLMDTGNDGLLALQADLNASLRRSDASLAETDEGFDEFRATALRTINDVFEPIIE